MCKITNKQKQVVHGMSNPLPVNEALVTVCLTTWGTVNVNRILGLEHLPDSRETGIEGPSQKQKTQNKTPKTLPFYLYYM